MGVRTTPWRLNDHEEDDEETSTAGGAEEDGGGMSGVVAAVPALISAYQGAVKDFFVKMSFATVGSASVGVDEVVGTVLVVDVVASAGRRGIVSGDVGRGGRES